MRALADRAALDRDTADLMTAVPPLAGILRYGDVRGSDTSSVAQVLRGIVLRVAIGLPGAGVGADEQTGAQLATAVDNVNAALALLQDEELTRAWREALRRVTDGDRLPGTLAGRATRLLHDAGELEPAKHMSRALSPGEDPERGASWIEGFIGTSGLILVHDPELLAALDGWVATVPQDAFTNVLPLLRRAFSAVPPTERRRLGETLRAPKEGQALFKSDEYDARARRARAGDRGEAARWLRNACADGGSCSAATRPRGQVRTSGRRTGRWTPRWPRCTASARAGWGSRRRSWRAGWVSCGRTSRAGSCGWCSRTRSTGSASTGCCWSPRCSRTSRPTCIWPRR